MSRSLRALVVAALAWGIAAALWTPPAAAAASVAVTPHENLADGQAVSVDGTGWPADTQIGVCEAVPDATPSQSDCISGGLLTTSSSSGSFSVPYHVIRRATSGEHGAVDCTTQRCVIAAAVYSDIAHTFVSTDISFNPAQIDVRLKNRSTGAISGDDVYNKFVQVFKRSFAPGTSFTFVFQVQNDGPATDDAIITASASPIATHITARYLVGYYDVTVPITGSGARIRNIAPGQIRTLAVSVSVAPAAVNREMSTFTLSFASGSGGGGDEALIQTSAHAP